MITALILSIIGVAIALAAPLFVLYEPDLQSPY